MKRLLLPLLAALVFPIVVEANWFGKYPSEREAMEACTDWMIKGPQRDREYQRYIWSCYGESSTRQILGLDEYGKVKKRYKY